MARLERKGKRATRCSFDPGSRGYWRRSFLVRTLNLTIGRFAVEASRELLRRRRRSRRASAEKKRRPAHATAITASTPEITNKMGFSEFMEDYLTHAFGM